MAHREKENQKYVFPLDLWTKETQIGRPRFLCLSRKVPTYQLKSITSQVHNDLDGSSVQINVQFWPKDLFYRGDKTPMRVMHWFNGLSLLSIIAIDFAIYTTIR